MTYKALYRNYRPQIFSDIAGQEHIVKTLKNAIKSEKIAHAYLFSGPRGTGKTTIAKLLAKAVNCSEELKPCGTCLSCLATKEGTHSDVIEIDAASNNGVDEVRDLIDKVKYAPIEGKYKIYIIDEVHMMTTGAFNALLKTLEEPPTHAIFILATTEPHKVIPTIVSRCQRFDFKKVQEKDIIERLTEILEIEGKQYSHDALVKISKLSDGGMRDALSILEQCLAYDDTLSIESIELIYGLLSMDHKINFLKKIITKDIKEVLSMMEYLLSSGKDIKVLTTELIDILKDCIIYKNTEDSSLLFSLTQDDIDSIIPYITMEEIFSMIDIFVEASLQYPKAVDVKIYFEVAIVKLCNKIEVNTKITDENMDINPIKLQELNVSTVEDNEKESVIVEEIKAPTSIGDNTFITKITELQNADSVTVDDLKSVNETTRKISESSVSLHEIKEKNNDISKDDILNVLVQAKKDYFVDIKDKWSIIPKYKYNLNTAKFASVFENGIPVAACPGALLITFEHAPQVDAANDQEIYYELKVFLKEVLGVDIHFIALEANMWVSIRNEFIQLKNSNSLPHPKSISFSHIKDYQAPIVEQSEAKKIAIDIFGSDIVEFQD